MDTDLWRKKRPGDSAWLSAHLSVCLAQPTSPAWALGTGASLGRFSVLDCQIPEASCCCSGFSVQPTAQPPGQMLRVRLGLHFVLWDPKWPLDHVWSFIHTLNSMTSIARLVSQTLEKVPTRRPLNSISGDGYFMLEERGVLGPIAGRKPPGPPQLFLGGLARKKEEVNL